MTHTFIELKFKNDRTTGDIRSDIVLFFFLIIWVNVV